MNFKKGRTDATDGKGSLKTLPRDYYLSPLIRVVDTIKIRGLTYEEGVALTGRRRSIFLQQQRGFSGSYSKSWDFDNSFFKLLLNSTWTPHGDREYKAVGVDNIFISVDDYALLQDDSLKAIVARFANDEKAFKKAFAEAWDVFMNADLYEPLPDRFFQHNDEKVYDF